MALVPDAAVGTAALVARQNGVIAGLPAAQMTVAEFDRRIDWKPLVEDGQGVAANQVLVELQGPARSILTAERTMLNVLAHLSGVATLTQRYVAAVQNTGAKIYDTRKTLPAWRRLEKYAVRMGGGHNHRMGLYDAVLIKDNHLAQRELQGNGLAAAGAVVNARQFLAGLSQAGGRADNCPSIVEIEVDSLVQLYQVLPARPDIVLLDNMAIADLTEAVRRRDAEFAGVELEASGGVTLATVGEIAATGVERISVGSLTHSAPAFDLALDWQ